MRRLQTPHHVRHDGMDPSVRVKPLQISAHPTACAIWMLYEADGRLRQRQMPVRDLRRLGASRAAEVRGHMQ